MGVRILWLGVCRNRGLLMAPRWRQIELSGHGVGLRLTSAARWLCMELRGRVSKDIARSSWRTCKGVLS